MMFPRMPASSHASRLADSSADSSFSHPPFGCSFGSVSVYVSYSDSNQGKPQHQPESKSHFCGSRQELTSALPGLLRLFRILVVYLVRCILAVPNQTIRSFWLWEIKVNRDDNLVPPNPWHHWLKWVDGGIHFNQAEPKNMCQRRRTPRRR